MDYFDIIKRAAKITWRFKYLWIFGFLAGISSGGFSSYNSGGTGDYSSPNIQAATITVKDFLVDNWIWVALVLAVLLLVGLVFFILSVISQGALIGCVDKIDEGEQTGFKDGLSMGYKKFWRILVMGITGGLVLLIAMLILGVPVALLFYFSMYVRAIILLLFALVIMVPLFVVVFFLNNWGFRYAVIENNKIMPAWKKGFTLFKDNLSTSLIMALLMFCIAMAAGIVFLVIALIIIIPFIVLGFASYIVAQGIGVAVVAVMGGVLFLIFAIFINAILSTFQSATWTLMFKEIAGGN